MTLRKVTGLFLFSILCVGSVFSSVSSAQHFSRLKQPVQTPLRWLGEGIGPGYRYHCPGPNVDYYNPYSAHNSTLISRSPEYQQFLYSRQYQQQRTFHQGIPFSVYASPQSNFHGYGHGYNHGYMSADSFEASELQTEEVDDEDGDKGYGDADDQDMEGEDDNAFRLRPQVIGSKPSAQPASTQLRPTVQQPLKHQHQILVKPEAVSAQIEISQPAEQQLVNPFGNN